MCQELYNYLQESPELVHLVKWDYVQLGTISNGLVSTAAQLDLMGQKC